MKTGVYTITNLVNNKIYVGSTMNSFNKRRNQHFHALRDNSHSNRHLQSSFNKHGESNFKFEILEECLPENCLEIEQYWINMLNVCDMRYGYNLTPTAGNRAGYKYSEDSKLKMVVSQLKFRNKSEKEIEDYLIKRKNPKPKETFEERSNRVKGEKNPFYGKKHTKETLALIKANLDYTKNYKKVAKCDLEDNILEEYESLKEAKLKNNLSSNGGICRALKLNKVYKEFKWKYL